jgi:hypothetical protein
MHTPKQETMFVMEMMGHMGEDSLDAIASRIYGRSYVGQQTGDMIGNDSHILYTMDKDMVEDILYNMNSEPKRHYLGYDSATRTAKYAEGVNWFEYWLGLKIEPGTYGDNSPTTVERAAPTPDYVLADLINRGELPYGTYLMHVWW